MEEPDYLPATQIMATQMLESTQDLADDDENKNETGVESLVGQLTINGDVYEVLKGETKIGRDPLCHVFINNPNLSRVHAIIEAENDGVTVHDNRSSNGSKKGSLVLKPHVRYDLRDGDQLKLGNLSVLFQMKKNEAVVADSDNESDSLLDDENENVPPNPNFVPDTPVVNKAVKSSSRPSLSDLSFVPESQSSPLPSSVGLIKKNSFNFKVPDSPLSDLNDSSFIASSQQPTTSIGNNKNENIPLSNMLDYPGVRAAGLARRQLTTNKEESATAVDESDLGDDSKIVPETQAVEDTIDETRDCSDLLQAETEKIDTDDGDVPAVERVDTKRLDGLFSSVRNTEELLNAETQQFQPSSSSTSLLVAETQPLHHQITDSSFLTVQPETKERLQSKMSDSEIMTASTQTLMAQLTTQTSTPTDSLILAAADLNDSMPDDEDDLLLAATQDMFKKPSLPSTTLLTADTEPVLDTPGKREEILEAETAPMFDDTKDELDDTTEPPTGVDDTTEPPNIGIDDAT